jgi:hypothetical protein
MCQSLTYHDIEAPFSDRLTPNLLLSRDLQVAVSAGRTILCLPPKGGFKGEAESSRWRDFRGTSGVCHSLGVTPDHSTYEESRSAE